MKYINKIIMATVVFTVALTSCTDDDFDSGLKFQKPSGLSMKEYLNQFDVLKSYVQQTDGSPFTIGVAVSPEDINRGGLAYSTLVSNFTAVDLGGAITPDATFTDAGTYDLSALTTASSTVAGNGLINFGGDLLSNQNQRAEYNKSLVAPTVLPSHKGYTTIDFEDYEFGTNVPMIGTWTGTLTTGSTGVVTLGDETHGKVLTVVANQGLPRVHVKLADGITLADCKSVSMDMKMIAGMYGAGLRLMFNNIMLDPKRNAASYGFTNNSPWKDRGIVVNFVHEGEDADAGTVVIPSSMLGLNEFDFVIGSASGDWRADIDNIRFTWETQAETIEKTDTEKKSLITAELDKWITSCVKAGDTNVSAWNIVGEPFDSYMDQNSFVWADYLGGTVQAAKTAIRIARAAGETKQMLFVANTFYQGEDMAAMARKLIGWVAEVEAQSGNDVSMKTAIDGYTVRLNAIYSAETSRQEINKKEITDLLTTLAATGKPVRISSLCVMYEDEFGNYITSNDVLSGERERVGEYLAFIISEYRKLVPAVQRWGVSIAGMTEATAGSNLCPWTSDFERTEIYEGIVNGLVK